MGRPMARNLIKAGFEVIVYNRTASKAEQMVSEGAKKAAKRHGKSAGVFATKTILSGPWRKVLSSVQWDRQIPF